MKHSGINGFYLAMISESDTIYRIWLQLPGSA